MKRLIWFLFGLLIVSGLVLTARAQETTSLRMLQVGLWTEFDQPSLLVIYRGEFSADTTYPLVVSLRMPARIPAPLVVAAQPAPNSGIDEVDFTNQLDGDWRIITFETGGPRFQFEYYDPLMKNGAQRAGTYVWPGDYAVTTFVVEFLPAPHTTELVTTPALPDSMVNASDGLTYYNGQFGPFQRGEQFSLQFNYTRDIDTLTIDMLQTLQSQSSAPAGPTTSGSSSAGSESAGGINALLLAVVAVVFFLLGAAAMRIAVNFQSAGARRRK